MGCGSAPLGQELWDGVRIHGTRTDLGQGWTWWQCGTWQSVQAMQVLCGCMWVLRPVPCCHTHHLLEEAMPVPAHSLHQMQKLHRGLATPHSVYGASAG